VLERALAEEMTEHLGYEKHDPSGRGSGNSRNGMTSKMPVRPVGVGLLDAIRPASDPSDPSSRPSALAPQTLRPRLAACNRAG